MLFEFATAGRIIFGAGTLAGIGPIAREFGRHALLVTGSDPHRAQPLAARLDASGVAQSWFRIPREPTVDDALRGVVHAREAGCDLVIGFGGGSAIDAAKAIAALLTNDAEPYDYLEVVGRGQPLTRAPAPCIAIPTTAGTGAEVTRNAVLTATDERVKVSLRSPLMLPRVALVDPDLTLDLPRALTASTGLDALTQLIEPYLSSRASPLTDALCVEGITRAARALRIACDEPGNRVAREDMALASLHGGLALANAGLGAVHGFAGPIGGMFSAPHGAICAALLPHVFEANLHSLRARAPASPIGPRFDQVARLLSGNPHATAADATTWLHTLIAALSIPPLRAYGITRADFPAIVSAATRASSMKANPLPLTPDELTAILERAL